MARRLTATQKRAILRDYRKMDVKTVLTKHEISRKLLYEVVGDKKRGARPRKINDHLTSIIVTNHFRGRTDHETAEMTGLSQDTVSRVRRNLGFKAVHGTGQGKSKAHG